MDQQNSPLENLNENEFQFLYQIKKELSLEDCGQAIQLAGSVLQALRQTLSLENAYKLIEKLPDFLRLMFVANWKQEDAIITIDHLDEFVSLVIEREQQKKNTSALFKNEVQTLSLIILTLKNLYRMVDLDQIEGFSSTLLQELRNVPSEAAA
jgi:uncharacterized protein (DUF2267 family)